MAVVPEKMNERDMCELADKIAASYMSGKACDSREFIETFLNVREASIRIIQERENTKIADYHNYMNKEALDAFDTLDEQTSLRSMFK